MSGGSRHLARQAAVQALYQWDLTEQAPEDILDHFIKNHDLNDADQGYFHVLVSEVPLFRQEVNARLTPYIDRDLDSVDPVERAILRIGAYELIFCHDVPTRVVLDEAIELGKRFGAEDSGAFINGVLDRLAQSMRKDASLRKSK